MSVGAVSSTDGLNYLSSSSSSSSSGLSVDTGTFLKLLVAQLQYQSPLDPQSNTDFVAQLAQMTSLQQMSGITSSIESSQAYSMIGKYIYAKVLNSNTGVTDCYVGTVDSVVIQSGTPYVVVGNTAIPVSDVTQVCNTSPEDTSAEKESV